MSVLDHKNIDKEVPYFKSNTRYVLLFNTDIEIKVIFFRLGDFCNALYENPWK